MNTFSLSFLSASRSKYMPEQVPVRANSNEYDTQVLQKPFTISGAELHLKFATWLDQALEDLEEFRALEEDWDSYGAAPITDVSLKAARRLLRAAAAGELNKPDFIAPLPRGGVQIEWRGKQDALEIEISPQAGMSYLLIKNFDGDRSFDKKENVDLYNIVMAVSLITSNLR